MLNSIHYSPHNQHCLSLLLHHHLPKSLQIHHYHLHHLYQHSHWRSIPHDLCPHHCPYPANSYSISLVGQHQYKTPQHHHPPFHYSHLISNCFQHLHKSPIIPKWPYLQSHLHWNLKLNSLHYSQHNPNCPRLLLPHHLSKSLQIHHYHYHLQYLQLHWR